MLYAILIAALILVVKWTLWRRKTVLVLCAAMLCAAVYFKARGETSTEFEGTWEMGFEQSDFFIGGNCARPRYWLHASEDVYSKVSTLRDPREVRIKFVGTSTRMGDYGHLGSIFEKSTSRRSSALSHTAVSPSLVGEKSRLHSLTFVSLFTQSSTATRMPSKSKSPS